MRPIAAARSPLIEKLEDRRSVANRPSTLQECADALHEARAMLFEAQDAERAAVEAREMAEGWTGWLRREIARKLGLEES